MARQVSRESARQQSLALDRLGRLAEANALLFSLHRVAQTLPASLDLDDVLDSSITRLRDLVEFDSVTVLLYEESDGSWVPVRRKGNRDQPTLDAETLPGPLQLALEARGTVHEPELAKAGGPGLAPRAASGLYCSLRSRGAQIGLIAVESDTPSHYGTKDVELLNGLVEPLGVAIDNARWFSRLRSIGADEERSRIARDLHDQIGQSLAYLGFELDRAVRVTKRSKFQPVLDRPRATRCARVVKEVRETLYDLRTDVSEAQDVGTTMQIFCDRVHERSGLDDPGPPARDGPPAPPAGAGAVAHRQGSGHERRAPRRGVHADDHVALRRQARRAERGGRRRGLRPPARAARTPTAWWACGSGPPPSAPPSRSAPLVALALPSVSYSTPRTPPMEDGRDDPTHARR